jgi:DNA segregation ATPase FtsK/SpoIIIE-like protein
MLVNVLNQIESAQQRQHGPYLFSEYLTDAARIHHEPAYVDAALYLDAVEIVNRLGIVSVDFLRRQFKLAYPQAMTLVRLMEDDGIIRRTDHRSCDQRQGWRYEVVA